MKNEFKSRANIGKHMTDLRSGDNDTSSKESQQQVLLWWHYFLWLVMALMFFQHFTNVADEQRQTLSYTEFKDKVRADEVARVTLEADEIQLIIEKGYLFSVFIFCIILRPVCCLSIAEI